MGCSSCGQKYRGLRKSTTRTAIPTARLRKPLYKKGRQIMTSDDETEKTVTETVEPVEVVEPAHTSSEEDVVDTEEELTEDGKSEE